MDRSLITLNTLPLMVDWHLQAYFQFKINSELSFNFEAHRLFESRARTLFLNA